MDLIVHIGGKAYLMMAPQPYVPPLPTMEPTPTERLKMPALFYGPPISASLLVKEDRREEIEDLGRLVLNGAELARRKADAEKREGN